MVSFGIRDYQKLKGLYSKLMLATVVMDYYTTALLLRRYSYIVHVCCGLWFVVCIYAIITDHPTNRRILGIPSPAAVVAVQISMPGVVPALANRDMCSCRRHFGMVSKN